MQYPETFVPINPVINNRNVHNSVDLNEALESEEVIKDFSKVSEDEAKFLNVSPIFSPPNQDQHPILPEKQATIKRLCTKEFLSGLKKYLSQIHFALQEMKECLQKDGKEIGLLDRLVEPEFYKRIQDPDCIDINIISCAIFNKFIDYFVSLLAVTIKDEHILYDANLLAEPLRLLMTFHSDVIEVLSSTSLPFNVFSDRFIYGLILENVKIRTRGFGPYAVHYESVPMKILLSPFDEAPYIKVDFFVGGQYVLFFDSLTKELLKVLDMLRNFELVQGEEGKDEDIVEYVKAYREEFCEIIVLHPDYDTRKVNF